MLLRFTLTPRSPNLLVMVLILLALAASSSPAPAATVLPVSGAALWYNADELGLAHNAGVSHWTDLSGSGYHGQQGNGDQQPTYITGALNGRSVVRFDGNNNHALGDYLASATELTISQPSTIFMIAKADATTGARRLFDRSDASATTDQRQTILLNGGSSHAYAGSVVNANFSSTAWNLHEVQFNGGNSSWRLNNSTTLSAGNFGSNNMGGTLILGGPRDAEGPASNGGAFFDGDIAEVIIFPTVLNAAQRRVMHSHLAAKYAMEAAISGERYTDPGTYDRDVFGITRAASDGSVVANGGMSGLRLSTNSFTTGDASLFAGYSNEASMINNTWTIDDVPTGVDERWSRVWYFDKTSVDDAAEIDVLFDFLAAGIAFDPSREYGLLMGDSPTNFSLLSALGTIDGGNETVTFSLTGADILDNHYYTLALLTQPVPEPSTLGLLAFALCGAWIASRRRRSVHR